MIVEFYTPSAFIPLHVAPSLGVNSSTEDIPSFDLDIPGFLPGQCRIAEQCPKTDPLQILGRASQTTQVGQGWVEIYKLHDLVTGLPFRWDRSNTVTLFHHSCSPR